MKKIFNSILNHLNNIQPIKLFSQKNIKKFFHIFMVFCLLLSAFLLARKAAELTGAGKISNIHIWPFNTASSDRQNKSSDDKRLSRNAGDASSQNKNHSANDSSASSNPHAISVVIDPGHGGNDPGKIGINGDLEKDLNLAIARKLQHQLTARQVKAILTRTQDICLAPDGVLSKKRADLQRRIDIIEKANPALTVSIHQNSFSDSSASGPQVFYYSESTEGKALATCIQACLNDQLRPPHPRVVKANASYFLLKNSTSPTVIVECGFLSNPSEAVKLTDEAYQEKVAKAISCGILSHAQLYPQSPMSASSLSASYLVPQIKERDASDLP